MPESTIAPPIVEAWPSIYLVVEWVTISQPNSNGLHIIGVAKVLSIMRGIPFACATFANTSISIISRLGFDIVSPKTAFVLG